MRFEHIEHLYLMLAIAPLTLAFVWYALWRKRAIKKLGNADLLQRLMPNRSSNKYYIKYILASVALIAISIAWANPQVGKSMEKVKRSGIDVIIALDVSKSMLAEDIKPDRLSRARQLVSNLLDELQNDRVGLIVFAGNAYLQMPLTSDKAAARLFLKGLSTDMVPTQGTAISEAIKLAQRSYVDDEQKYKALIIITDGENHEGDALVAAENASETGIVVHTVGIGDPKGAPIPVNTKGRSDFKRDAGGNIVLTKLNETALQQIAGKGGGNYFRLGSGTDELAGLLESLDSMEQRDFDEQIITDYEDQFQWFIGLAIILLTLDFLLAERKSLWLRKFTLFRSLKQEEA